MIKAADTFDTLVVGAGPGGLGAALVLGGAGRPGGRVGAAAVAA